MKPKPPNLYFVIEKEEIIYFGYLIAESPKHTTPNRLLVRLFTASTPLGFIQFIDKAEISKEIPLSIFDLAQKNNFPPLQQLNQILLNLGKSPDLPIIPPIHNE